jgi:capsular exopolysaccharide synthesis family protein
VDTNRTLYDGLLQRYKEVGIAGGVGTNNVSIVDRALAPRKPAVPDVPLYLGMSAILGLILALGTAFILDALDQGVSAPADIEARLHLPLMGVAPITARGVTPAQALGDPRSALSEAVNAIRTALQFSTNDGAPRTLLVTSSRSAEGKTTTAAALATSFARLGQRVLLVDGDLRNPSVHRLLGVTNTTGLARFLSGGASFDQIIQTTSAGSLSVAPCGPLPPNPSELLAGPGLATFLQQAGDAFDLVIIDGPPVVGLSDAASLAAAVVATLFVVEAGKVRRAVVREAIRRLEAVEARIVGAVLCKFNARNAAYGYEYPDAYAHGAYGAKPAHPAA